MLTVRIILLLIFTIAAVAGYRKSKSCFSLLRGIWYEDKWIPHPFLPESELVKKSTKEFTLAEPGLINLTINGRRQATGECVSFSVLLRETETSCGCQFKLISTSNTQGDTSISDLSLIQTRFKGVIIFFGCLIRESRTAKCTRPDAWVLMRNEFLTRKQSLKVDKILRKLGLGKYLDNGEFSLQSTGPKCIPV